MSEIEITVEQTPEETEAKPFFNLAHRVLLAGIGAVALTQEEIEKFVNRLVERGEIAEQDGRQMLNDVMERRRRKTEAVEVQIEETMESAGSEMDRHIENILHKMNVPTKSDIDTLSLKISLLADKVDQLQQARTATAAEETKTP